MNVVWCPDARVPSVSVMRRTTSTRTVLATGVLAAMLLLAGCSASGGASDESGGVAGAPVQAPGVVGEDSSVDGFSLGSEADADREVIVTGTMTVTAEDP